jgi:hypothetical protein
MQRESSEWVGRILDCVKEGLGPYVLARYKARYPFMKAAETNGEGVKDYVTRIRQMLAADRQALVFRDLHTEADLLQQLDAYSWLTLLVHREGRPMFRDDLTRFHLGCAMELRDYRNRWARQHPISYDDALRAADSAERLLRKIGAWENAETAAEMRDQIKRLELTLNAGWQLQSIAENTEFDESYTQPIRLPANSWIEIRPKDELPQRHRLDKPRVVLGRSRANTDIQVCDKRVSRIHLQIVQFIAGELAITDLHSANGTLINGERIEPNHPISWSQADVVTIGDTQLAQCAATNTLVDQDNSSQA